MKKRFSFRAYLLILVSVLLFAPSIWAADFPEISTPDLKNKLDAKESFFLLNASSDIEFNLGHIPGAVNVPGEEIGENPKITNKLPQDKETPIVVC
jgi:rhodanese-related sulfurtransferase